MKENERLLIFSIDEAENEYAPMLTDVGIFIKSKPALCRHITDCPDNIIMQGLCVIWLNYILHIKPV